MKRIIALFLSLLLILLAFSACAGKSESPPKADSPSAPDAPKEEAPDEPDEEPVVETLKGELCEAERFTIVAPEGWKVLEFPGPSGFQLYRAMGEVVQIEYAGSNQSDEAAKNEVKSFAENYDGTEPAEIEMLGKRFWFTVYEYNGEDQTIYARMEDGVKLTIQTVKGNYENNEEYKAILDSVVFK